MLDFYNELKKFNKAKEPKDLKNIIKRDRKDFIDIAISIVYGEEDIDRHFEVDEE